SFVFILLLFNLTVDYRYLHSFPTRRSSDLIVAFDLVLIEERTVVHLDQAFQSDNEVGINGRGAQAPGANRQARGGFCCRGARKKDRKSTRLNSSHDQMSYAVFCLKKKKKKN